MSDLKDEIYDATGLLNCDIDKVLEIVIKKAVEAVKKEWQSEWESPDELNDIIEAIKKIREV